MERSVAQGSARRAETHNDSARDDGEPRCDIRHVEQIVVEELVAGVLVDVVPIDRLRHVLAFFDEAGHATKGIHEEVVQGGSESNQLAY